MKRLDKFNFAIQLLQQNNITPTEKRLCLNCFGDIVIHSKQLKNCIIIPPQATARTIQNMIKKQVTIAKA